MFKQRILVQFSIQGDVRFVSHHDLMRLLARAARRAGLPVAMSEGFNPRPRISLLLARGVGVASEGELAEFDLGEWVSAGEFTRRLAAELPDGVRIERADIAHPNVRNRVVAIDYRVRFRGGPPVGSGDVERFLALREAPVERERKKAHGPREVRRVDVRPLVTSLGIEGDAVEMSLAVTEQGTTRVEEVFQALGVAPGKLLEGGEITRTAMRLG